MTFSFSILSTTLLVFMLPARLCCCAWLLQVHRGTDMSYGTLGLSPRCIVCIHL